MIVVDTSALMATVLDEEDAERCMQALEAADELTMSATTVAEALIVARRRNVGPELESLIDGMGVNIVPLTAAGARRVAQAYAQRGRGIDPAGLNFGDCFAYAEARETKAALLYSVTISVRPM